MADFKVISARDVFVVAGSGSIPADPAIEATFKINDKNYEQIDMIKKCLRFGKENGSPRSNVRCSGVETDTVAVFMSVGSGPTCNRNDFRSPTLADEDGTTLPDTERPFKPNGTGGFRTPAKKYILNRNKKIIFLTIHTHAHSAHRNSISDDLTSIFNFL